MSASKKAIKKTETNAKNETVEVLYQRIGDRWYAFSALEEDVFFGEIPQEVINPEIAKDGNQ